MTKNVKIGLIFFSVVGASVGTYYLIQYFKLKKAYSTTLTPQQATTLIDTQTQNVGDTIIPDDISKNADASKGVIINDDSTIDNSSTPIDFNSTLNGSLYQANVLNGMGDY
jgi:hypothetical protein